jgi:hypothetical protein
VFEVLVAYEDSGGTRRGLTVPVAVAEAPPAGPPE